MALKSISRNFLFCITILHTGCHGPIRIISGFDHPTVYVFLQEDRWLGERDFVNEICRTQKNISSSLFSALRRRLTVDKQYQSFYISILQILNTVYLSPTNLVTMSIFRDRERLYHGFYEMCKIDSNRTEVYSEYEKYMFHE